MHCVALMLVAAAGWTSILAHSSRDVATAQVTVAQLSKPPGSQFGTNDPARRHQSPTGQICMKVTGFARAHIVNPNVYDHMIGAQNTCSQSIKMQVCYAKSTRCIAMEVPARSRKEAVLGIAPSEKQFRFEFREQF